MMCLKHSKKQKETFSDSLSDGMHWDGRMKETLRVLN